MWVRRRGVTQGKKGAPGRLVPGTDAAQNRLQFPVNTLHLTVGLGVVPGGEANPGSKCRTEGPLDLRD